VIRLGEGHENICRCDAFALAIDAYRTDTIRSNRAQSLCGEGKDVKCSEVFRKFREKIKWIREQDVSAAVAIRSCLHTLQPPRSKEEQDALVQLQDFVLRAWNETRLAAVALDEASKAMKQGSVEKTLTNTIDFGGVTLSLGMTQDSALAKLNGNYTTRDKGDGKWEVSSTEDKVPLGTVDFTNRKLTGAERQWPIESLTALGLANSLYDVTSSFVEEGRIYCTIDTWNQHKPGSEMKITSISCGHKAIDIEVANVGKDHILGLMERLK
jgi:hypothetical protein